MGMEQHKAEQQGASVSMVDLPWALLFNFQARDGHSISCEWMCASREDNNWIFMYNYRMIGLDCWCFGKASGIKGDKRYQQQPGTRRT